MRRFALGTAALLLAASPAMTGRAAMTQRAAGDEAVAVTGSGVAATGGPVGLARTDIARGVLSGGGPVELKPGLDAVVLKIVLQPGGSSGWHSHYDGGVLIVTKGVLSNYGLDGPACDVVQVSAGNAYFVPPHAHHAHLARNEGAEVAEATIYYFNVPVGQSTAAKSERPRECPADLD